MLLVVIIIFSIAIFFGGKISSHKKNYFVSNYIISLENIKIKLFNREILNNISSMLIDDKKVNITNYFIFKNKGIHKVEVFLKNELTSMEKLFRDCSNLIEVDLSKLITTKVTTFAEMFYNCYLLFSIDLSKLNTSKVRNMSNLFDGCFNLESINLKKIDTSKVKDMNYMFYSCVNLKSLDLRSFNTSKVKNMTGLFIIVIHYLI